MFLNMAWNAVFDVLLEFQELEDWYEGIEKTEINEYWKAAQKNLSIAHALAQQGAEMALKSKIASISPYLLINSPSSGWPKLSDKHDTAFADFRTVDSQDLVRICNTVLTNHLSEQFVSSFEGFRKQRNALFHTVDKRLGFPEKEIVSYILLIADLIRPKQWPLLRASYLEETPISKTTGPDYVMNQVCLEMEQMIKLVDRKLLQDLFGFNKKQRRYICPHCYWSLNRDSDPPYPRTAQLTPNNSQSSNLYCFVCGKNISVARKKCTVEDCNGNVINAEKNGKNECLTCFEYY